jgi:hypothetical protein
MLIRPFVFSMVLVSAALAASPPTFDNQIISPSSFENIAARAGDLDRLVDASACDRGSGCLILAIGDASTFTTRVLSETRCKDNEPACYAGYRVETTAETTITDLSSDDTQYTITWTAIRGEPARTITTEWMISPEGGFYRILVREGERITHEDSWSAFADAATRERMRVAAVGRYADVLRLVENQAIEAQ